METPINDNFINENSNSTINNSSVLFTVMESKQFNYKETTASTFALDSKDELGKSKKTFKIDDLIKRKVLNMLDNENIDVGYTSMAEIFLQDLVDKDIVMAKEILNHVYIESLNLPSRLQKFIEVMSNLDYEVLYPTNSILALGVINNVDIGVQEAAIAAFEKWDDPRNISSLKSTKYSVDWIEEYANNVINYLESC